MYLIRFTMNIFFYNYLSITITNNFDVFSQLTN